MVVPFPPPGPAGCRFPTSSVLRDAPTPRLPSRPLRSSLVVRFPPPPTPTRSSGSARTPSAGKDEASQVPVVSLRTRRVLRPRRCVWRSAYRAPSPWPLGRLKSEAADSWLFRGSIARPLRPLSTLRDRSRLRHHARLAYGPPAVAYPLGDSHPRTPHAGFMGPSSALSSCDRLCLTRQP